MRGWMARVANRPNSRSKSSLNQVGCRARITLTDFESHGARAIRRTSSMTDAA